MKKKITKPMLAFVTALFFFGCSSSKKNASGQTQNIGTTQVSTETFTNNRLSPVIDGKANEWSDKLFSYDKASQTKYAVANDAANLYLAIIARDPIQQMKMIKGGIEVWIGINLKKDKTIKVKFPIGGEAIPMPDRSGTMPTQEQMKQEARGKMGNMELKGFKNEFNGVQSVYSTAQVKPVIDWDAQNTMVYELAIPFSAMQDADVTNLKNIIVGIIYKGLKMPDGMPSGGMPPEGMQPPPGMTQRGGGAMPDISQIQNFSKENSIWTRYTIIK